MEHRQSGTTRITKHENNRAKKSNLASSPDVNFHQHQKKHKNSTSG